jgi:2-amino-4-hydroxy-6-hydroxymethyldihydropteridine diphosphokinase
MKRNNAILLLGSNIQPEDNIKKALDLLAEQVDISQRSRIWETGAVGSSGPNFLNVAVEIETPLSAVDIKQEVITPIENRLKRVRTQDKYAPRTMDIDIILYNGEVLDSDLWKKAFVAIPVSELLPGLIHPTRKTALSLIAEELKSSAFAEPFM